MGLSLRSPNKAVLGVSGDRTKLFSKKVANCCQNEITEVHSLKICNDVSSSLLQKEHNGVISIRKANNF